MERCGGAFLSSRRSHWPRARRLSADGEPQKPPARLIEATVTSDGQVVPVQAAVEKLNDGAGARGASPCGPPINMDAATGRALVQKVAQEEGFYPEFVLAVAHAESQFDPNALSPKGAIGLMQLEPATADRYKVKICDPANNVRGGIRFLRDLHARYKNPLFILAAYNAGEIFAAISRRAAVPGNSAVRGDRRQRVLRLARAASEKSAGCSIERAGAKIGAVFQGSFALD